VAGEIYLLRWKRPDRIEVYDVITYRVQRCLTVPNCRGFADITSCGHCLCVYIADDIAECLHRLPVQGIPTRWAVDDVPCGISVNAKHNVIVTCRKVRKIKEFGTHGNVVREICLPGEIVNPRHAVQSQAQFIVCHGRLGDSVHRVCTVSGDGRHIVHSHGGQPGSDIGQFDVPVCSAVDSNKFVFVVDRNNCRVTLLSPTLNYVGQVVSSSELKWEPVSLHLDTQRRRLYVASNEWDGKNYTLGRVVVFSV